MISTGCLIHLYVPTPQPGKALPWATAQVYSRMLRPIKLSTQGIDQTPRCCLENLLHNRWTGEHPLSTDAEFTFQVLGWVDPPQWMAQGYLINEFSLSKCP